MSNPKPITRRRLLQVGATTAAALSMPAASYARVLGSNARLNVAFVGVGGIASGQHVGNIAGLGAGCTCYCDADRNRWGAAAKRWKEAKGYTDFRAMFDRHEEEIDAVMVGTPDHTHFPATLLAMSLGKHAYTQKPLTHTPWEARELARMQAKTKLATQMGNQGHASESLRVTIDYLRSGAIGDLVEAHVWTDRPWWRQGRERPGGEQPTPEHLDWDSWLGPAPARPFRHDPADKWGGLYHPFNWRGFWDFGCGALGDMGCHEVDPVYWAMEPGYPTAIELVDTEPFGDADMYAAESTVRFEFPAKGSRPGFALLWYEGGRKPARPEELDEGEELTKQGALYIGTEGKMIALGNARSRPRLLPRSRHDEVGAPEPQIERSAHGHHGEWYRACVGDEPYDHPKSNFAYAAPFTEALLLGCIAQRVGGRLVYDAKEMQFPGREDATALITKEYREGWEF